MAEHQITCVVVKNQKKHDHIIEVGGNTRKWTVSQAYDAMDKGDTFYTEKPKGSRASVKKFHCGECNFDTLRSGPDATKENNLDNMPNC